ncbi:MAG: RNA polymerase sigma factor SigJ [Gemmatimonadota bacterium]
MESDGVEIFEAERERLIGLAYRMLGSRAAAEDVVQDVWLRWQAAPVTEIERPPAWLTTATTRRAIDRLRREKVAREHYVGPWLPEPLVSEAPPPTVERALELADDLSLAFLLVLERLGVEERAAFLLHDVFGAPYREIAEALEKSEAAVRQIASRARRRIQETRPRFTVSPRAQQQMLERFREALAAQSLEELITLFTEDAVLLSDGGGKALAARNPVVGPDRIARFFLGLNRPGRFAPVQVLEKEINGVPGYLLLQEGVVVSALTVDLREGRIEQVFVVRNPDKLAGILGSAAPTPSPQAGDPGLNPGALPTDSQGAEEYPPTPR